MKANETPPGAELTWTAKDPETHVAVSKRVPGLGYAVKNWLGATTISFIVGVNAENNIGGSVTLMDHRMFYSVDSVVGAKRRCQQIENNPATAALVDRCRIILEEFIYGDKANPVSDPKRDVVDPRTS